MSSVMQELLAQSSFDKLKEGAIVPGTITEIRQNEVVVDIGGKSEGLVPAHEFLDIGELQIGSTIEVLVQKLEDKSGAPILSFDLAEQKKNWDNILTKFPEGSIAAGRVKAKRRNLLDSIQPGQVRKGVVKNITDFGAFIDLDGMDGLLHITDMSWGRIT